MFRIKKHRKQWSQRNGFDIDVEEFIDNSKNLRKTFESLGPVWIKLGQWLSSRAELLPQPYMRELEYLTDRVPADPFHKIKPTIEKSLGAKIDEKFDSFDKEEIKGASLGQVYRAKIQGKDVAVKVKRPDIEKRVKKDLEILKIALPLALGFVDKNLVFSARGLVSQFIDSIYEELDYELEANNLNKIKENLANNDRVIIPNVHDKPYSSKDVLTMDYLPGIRITDRKTMDEKGINREQVMMDVYNIFFTMLLRDPIFHADPHAGNIAVNDGSISVDDSGNISVNEGKISEKDKGKIILYDFGMVGRLGNETRLLLVRLYLALIDKDSSRTVNIMNELGMLDPNFNRPLIEMAIDLSIREMHGHRPSEIETEAFVELANRTMGKFPFKLPKQLALYLRMTTIIEGIYYKHDIKFKFAKVFSNLLRKESLVEEAYYAELNYQFETIKKTCESIFSFVPDLHHFLQRNEGKMDELIKKTETTVILPISIFASALFAGGGFLYQTHQHGGITAMICGGLLFFGLGYWVLFKRK